MATIGKNILDNLTTGMYSDSRVIYREYIQNACDQIDLAVKLGILLKQEGQVDIFIDSSKRYISILDNATGVKSESFVEDLGDIANSNKQIGKNKGFRGIGRLCGLAYCKTLKFKTSYYGEDVASIMICDAKKMREMLVENKKYTIDEIWETIVKYDTEPEDDEKHYFEVQMIDINRENTDLLDEKRIKEYLNFVAPVPYKNTFILRSSIYGHAEELGCTIDEYCVQINGQQIFKEYTTKIKEQSGANLKNYDEISKLEFKEFYDKKDNLIAWMWYGLSRFEKSIPKVNQMRGIRVRSGNIQIGNDDVVQDLFKEHRGNYYFVGEVFAEDERLIPNSQRDYFNENETRVEFEDELRTYFYDVLHPLYYDANRLKNAYKKQEEYVAKVDEFNKKISENGFVNVEEQQKMRFEIEKVEKEAKDARKQIDRFKEVDEHSPIVEVQRSIEGKFKADKLQRKVDEKEVVNTDLVDKKQQYITSSMSKLSKSERKLVSKLLTIINEVAPKDVAEEIIDKIKEELR
jgi:molecular chaperone HtpG